MAEQKDAAINMMGQSLFSGDAYNQRQQNFNMAAQALQMQAQRQQANNELSGAIRDNYEQTMTTANAAAVRPFDKQRLEFILGGGYERVIQDIKDNYNGDFTMYSNTVDASGVSGADKIRNIFFNDDLQGLYQELNHNKKQFAKIIDLQKNNKSHLIPKAYSLALEEWQQNGPTDSKPTLSRLPTFYQLQDPTLALEEKFKSLGGNYGASPEDILEVASKEISHNMSLEGYTKEEMEIINRDLALGRGPGYDAAVQFVQNNHVTSGLVNPQSPDYVSGSLSYGKGDIINQMANQINLESIPFQKNTNYNDLVKTLNDKSEPYINQAEQISNVRQSKLPFENYGPFTGKGSRAVTGAVLYDNSTDLKNIMEATLPGYDVNMGSAFGFNKNELILNNYDILKHQNVYSASGGNLLTQSDSFDLAEGLTAATGLGLAGAGAGSVTGPGALLTGAGGFVAGGLLYAASTESDMKDLSIEKIVVGYKINLGGGKSELLMDFQDKNDPDFKSYIEKFEFDDSDPAAGTIEPVHLAYGRDQDPLFTDGYLIELNFNPSAQQNISKSYAADREGYERSIDQGIQQTKTYESNINAQKIKNQRSVQAVTNAQSFISNMFGEDKDAVKNVENIFGSPLRLTTRSLNIPEEPGKQNQTLLLAEILVTSQYYQDKNTKKYSKLADNQGTKIGNDALNKINNIGTTLRTDRGKLKTFQTMRTEEIIKGMSSMYPKEVVNDIKKLTIALRDLKNNI